MENFNLFTFFFCYQIKIIKWKCSRPMPCSLNFQKFSLLISLTITGTIYIIWTASSEFGTYRLCEQRRFSRSCASAQSRQNLRCSLIQAMSQEELSDRKPDPWPLWMAGHTRLKSVMTECSKTQIRLTGLIFSNAFLFLIVFFFFRIE